MDRHQELAAQAMQAFEDYRPEFFRQCGLLQESLYANVVFYKTILLVVQEHPWASDTTQAIVIGRLTMLHDAAQAELFDKIDKDLRK